MKSGKFHGKKRGNRGNSVKRKDLDELRLKFHQKVSPAIIQQRNFIKNAGNMSFGNFDVYCVENDGVVVLDSSVAMSSNNSSSDGIPWVSLTSSTTFTDDKADSIVESPSNNSIYQAGDLIHTTVSNTTTSSQPLKVIHNSSIFTYNIPRNSSFITTSMQHFPKTSQYDFIIMDPPWPNHSVKRKSNSYNTLTDIYDLYQLPIRQIIEPSPSSILAIWTTNAQKHKLLAEKLLAHFLAPCTGPNLVLSIQTIIWCKVTETFEFTTPLLESSHRHPYELLLVGQYSPQHSTTPKIYFSTPTIHSQKPIPLITHLARNAKRPLEIFARNLLPNFTSWGNEPLRNMSFEMRS